MTERIEGEFHYATGDRGEWGSWAVYRKSDDKSVMGCASDVDAKPLVEALDESARHFIEGERERIARDLAKIIVNRADFGGTLVQAVFDYGKELAATSEGEQPNG